MAHCSPALLAPTTALIGARLFDVLITGSLAMAGSVSGAGGMRPRASRTRRQPMAHCSPALLVPTTVLLGARLFDVLITGSLAMAGSVSGAGGMRPGASRMHRQPMTHCSPALLVPTTVLLGARLFDVLITGSLAMAGSVSGAGGMRPGASRMHRQPMTHCSPALLAPTTVLHATHSYPR
jgi:hypothetical protein